MISAKENDSSSKTPSLPSHSSPAIITGLEGKDTNPPLPPDTKLCKKLLIFLLLQDRRLIEYRALLRWNATREGYIGAKSINVSNLD